jgi:hypothetical protein
MSEFVMDGRNHAARAESEFVLGFIEAMFFTNVEPSLSRSDWFKRGTQRRMREGQISCLPSDAGYCDLSPESLQSIREFCQEFQTSAANLLSLAYRRHDYDERQAGADLWFTSQGHGVGFWDRSQLDSGDLGDKLSDAATSGDAWLTFARPGVVHVEGL